MFAEGSVCVITVLSSDDMIFEVLKFSHYLSVCNQFNTLDRTVHTSVCILFFVFVSI